MDYKIKLGIKQIESDEQIILSFLEWWGGTEEQFISISDVAREELFDTFIDERIWEFFTTKVEV